MTRRVLGANHVYIMVDGEPVCKYCGAVITDRDPWAVCPKSPNYEEHQEQQAQKVTWLLLNGHRRIF